MDISNGTCYWAQGAKASPAIIPCGNDAFGHATCCEQGDWCLGSNACYNAEFGVTYLFGCSDPDYRDPSCPDKSVFPGGYPWLGLVYCNGTSRQWAACPQKKKPTLVTSPDPCYCPETSPPIAFTEDSRIPATASLPAKAGGTISWAPEFSPTTVTMPTAAATRTGSGSTNFTPTATSDASTATGISATPTASSAAPSETPRESGLSSGASIGIGVGIAIGALLLIALLAFFIWRFLKKRKTGQPPELSQNEPQPPKVELGPGDNSTVMTASELDPASPRPWSMSSEQVRSILAPLAEVTYVGGSAPQEMYTPGAYRPYRPAVELPA
ncbi:hypothetical protein QBC34DRAFT_438847 [Podospora aff. communis PSN243]|uniref:Uncharacterized protein n=1 Tax=Podospora aff. communis PSN243 TaxID=3040156 RepID=A0AAV9GL77_9PEZI|nr:hypothetical protein QBC34DRAFT_438847 [Podospora aff. communis PSN243]